MRSFRWVAMVLLETLLLLVIALLWAIHVARRPDFPELTLDPTIETQDHAFDWRDRDCQVLFDGDSTASIGIDPRVITAKTGLSACNIAATRPVADALGMLPLDVYLSRNRPPRLLVLQFAPETFYRSGSSWDTTPQTLPMILVSRHFSSGRTLLTMLRHPLVAYDFELFVLRAELFDPGALRENLTGRFRHAVAYARASGGQQEMDFPPETVCSQPPAPLRGPVDGQWVAGLRRKYEGEGIAVLIRAAPIANCDPQLLQFQHDLAPYVDGNVVTKPIGWFMLGGRHPTLSAAQVNSADMADLIRTREPNLMRKPAR